MRVLTTISPIQTLALSTVIGLGILGAGGCGPKDNTGAAQGVSGTHGVRRPSGTPGGRSPSDIHGTAGTGGMAGGGTTGQ